MPIERSAEFDRVLRLYEAGKIADAGLDKAVQLGLITADERILVVEMAENDKIV